jgi:two-component system sensor histidine kinase DctS
VNSPVPGRPLPREPSAVHGWQWIAPRAAIALFVAALLGLLWVLHRQELDDKRTAVIRDILWLEQNLRFGLARDLDHLGQLGAEAPRVEAAQLERRVAFLLQNAPGLEEVVVLDADGKALAGGPAPVGAADRWGALGRDPTFALARSTGRPAWAAPRRDGDGVAVAVFVPQFRGGRFTGAAVGVYELKRLLANLVPWWLAEKHLVTIRDGEGAVLARKSNVEAHQPELSHQVPLDPPGHGLVLHVESWGGETQLLRNSLTATVVVLAAIVLANLWALRRHVRRRLATEEALRIEHAFRKAMEDSIVTGMRAVDMEGRLTYVNRAFCNMVGFSEEELVGKLAPRPYWPPDEAQRIQEGYARARSEGAPPEGIEMRWMRRDGERFDVLVYEAPLIDAEGRQAGWMASVLDITERKRARELAHQQEEKLAATARLVTVGEMASTIAHELNQPLSAIASYATGCLNLLEGEGAASPEELRGALGKTVQQAQRAGRIIRRVHDFVRKSEPTRAMVRMSAVVEEAVGFAEAEARKRQVRIQSRLDGDDPELLADPVLMQQVVLNLLRNAMDAMAATPADAREIRVSTEAANGGVTVSIADRGCGIDPQTRAHLFEPFFSTKSEGMGMGLNICRSILELHRGRVWAEPNPEGGTVFSFSLPVERA